MRLTTITAIAAAIAACLMVGWSGPAVALNVGDKAPDFELPATTQEKPLKLSVFLGKKNVVLFGFVGAYTPT